jgi:hypothetical protein
MTGAEKGSMGKAEINLRQILAVGEAERMERKCPLLIRVMREMKSFILSAPCKSESFTFFKMEHHIKESFTQYPTFTYIR